MTQTVPEFMLSNAIIRVSCEKVDSRPDGIAWGKCHYLHVFGYKDGFLEVYVSHGAVEAPPTSAEETLGMTINDARDGQLDPFEFLEKFYDGVTVNYREAKIAYEATRRARRNLRDFLGNRLFERAIRQVEE